MTICMDYQRGGSKAFPEWVPSMLPQDVEDLTEQVSQGSTRDPAALFETERAELERAFFWASELESKEVPL